MKSPPYVHTEDLPFIDAANTARKIILQSHRSFVNHSSFGDFGDRALHLGLLPVPYQGNLSRADIFIVVLNPGLGLSDYQTGEDAGHVQQLRSIIHQQFGKVRYPFLSLNPEYAWTGGFQWWEQKLRRVIQKLAAEYCEGNYAAALFLLSQRLAAIEVFPYRSRTFGAGHLRSMLPSVRVAKEFVQSLVPRARREEVTIVVSRGIKAIGLEDHKLANYDARLARGASLGPETLGGNAILDAFRARPPAV
ncbi:hypothetical protein [Bradyrhizobium sp. DOA9]|uniref:hypothetical protein n=1 Tax=Bradyrhizobium sp. DOA9 TaxID=1126627 RepID=UPI0007237185|nr:hypothetical protein [Bradyrhizobium sp. DOA9]GAJ36112.1 hypothetical protein BDOA9_0153250 [Bradyrhizobium sp. DOA9]